jgi:hypothetical protein
VEKEIRQREGKVGEGTRWGKRQGRSARWEEVRWEGGNVRKKGQCKRETRWREGGQCKKERQDRRDKVGEDKAGRRNNVREEARWREGQGERIRWGEEQGWGKGKTEREAR